MRLIESAAGAYLVPRHHKVYSADGTHAVDSTYPHGEAGYLQAAARVKELGGQAELRFAEYNWQYVNSSRGKGIENFPFHGKSDKTGDGETHTPLDYSSERSDKDRIQIAELGRLSEKYPNTEIMVGIGGEDVIMVQEIPTEDGKSLNRSIYFGSAKPIFPHEKSFLPEEYTSESHLVTVVRQRLVDPAVSERQRSTDNSAENKLVFGIMNVDQWDKVKPLDIKEFENSLGLDVKEALLTLEGGLAIYQQKTRIWDEKYRPKIPVTCIDPTYDGRFPFQYRSILEALQTKNYQLS